MIAGEKVVCIFAGQPYQGKVVCVFRRTHSTVFDVQWDGRWVVITHNADDEGLTWIRGDHALDSAEVRALMTAWALVGAERNALYFGERRR